MQRFFEMAECDNVAHLESRLCTLHGVLKTVNHIMSFLLFASCLTEILTKKKIAISVAKCPCDAISLFLKEN